MNSSDRVGNEINNRDRTGNNASSSGSTKTKQ